MGNKELTNVALMPWRIIGSGKNYRIFHNNGTKL